SSTNARKRSSSSLVPQPVTSRPTTTAVSSAPTPLDRTASPYPAVPVGRPEPSRDPRIEGAAGDACSCGEVDLRVQLGTVEAADGGAQERALVCLVDVGGAAGGCAVGGELG